MNPSLKHYWKINLAVLLGAAVATAVLTGALLVGDSVRGSLRDLTLDRLGRIDHALVADRYFREALALDLAGQPGFANQYENAIPAILIKGSAVHTGSQSRASNINIIGMDERLSEPFEESLSSEWAEHLRGKAGQSFASVVINEALQRELDVNVGDQILLAVERRSDVHRESLFGSTEYEDVVRKLRLTLTYVLPDRGIGRFGLLPNQNLPLNAYVYLPVLQRALEQDQRVNAILVSEKPARLGDGKRSLQSYLDSSAKLEDYGLRIRRDQSSFSLETSEFVLKSDISEKAKSVAEELQAPVLPILTYLANAMTANGKLLPYSTITALNPPPSDHFGVLKLIDGSIAPGLADDEILVNEWAASDLGLKAGDAIDVSFFQVGSGGALSTGYSAFRLKGILPIAGLAGDPTLAPEFPGIQDAENMADWNPPFPINLNLIRPKDEAYWDIYRGTPKAFVSEAVGRKLWRSRFGDLTSIRVAAAPDKDLQLTRIEFEKRFLQEYTPAQAGLIFRPVKEQGLQASEGATDFGMLFIGFSLFLIVSAALLVGLLFRLGVEQRAVEVGVLLSVGYPVKKIRGMYLRESLIVAGIGCLLGLAGAILYSGLVMTGLRTWWVDAIGTPFLFLHINSASLAIGYFAALLVVLFSIWRTLRRLGKVPTPSLLFGVTSLESKTSGRFSRITAFASLLIAFLLVAFAAIMGQESSAEIFMASGALLLISGLSFLSLWLRKSRRRDVQLNKAFGLRQMSTNSAARFPGRSMLCTALVACACFVIVAVGANRRYVGTDFLNRNSGAGGFSLVAESDIPLFSDLNSDDGRFDLGFNETDSREMDTSRVMSFRLLPGEDASCLNLYKPQKPRILGVPKDQIERGGFQFQARIDNAQNNPWRLLQREIEPGVIPAIGDYNSVMWILHLGLGKDLVLQDEFGQDIRLRLVGLLQKSIFQSEILISEEDFLKHFPSRNGYSYFLIETSLEKLGIVSQLLERNLTVYGMDVTSSAERLDNFQAVENTYLAVFQTLGGLGLLLGTLGLAIILFRNSIERKGELATLRAFGFRRSRLSSMLLAENGFLILLGILIGTAAAMISVLPHLTGGAAQVPWLSLILTLLTVFIVGLIASAAAVSAVLRIPLLPALKAE